MCKKIIGTFIKLSFALIVVGCNSPKKEILKQWTFQETINLEEVNPIGIALKGEEIWLSDADHNRLVQINEKGVIITTIEGFDRPMHIDANETAIYVPQYGSDTIAVVKKEIQNVLPIEIKLDAPAGISIYKNEMAIADFYNNQIHYFNGGQWNSFGSEGNATGQFYYPTDVQITKDEIWVADAYNHRVQVFDKQGSFLKAIAYNQGINAATGIYVSNKEVFITDFENNRILIFDHQGVLKQELKDKIHKPTDMIIRDEVLYTLNYRKGTLNIYYLTRL